MTPRLARRRRALLGAWLLSLACVGASAQAGATCADLRREVRSALAALPSAPVAVQVVDEATGCTASVNADKPAPMLSVYKLPIAIAVYDAADRGLDLHAALTVTPADAVGGHSPLGGRLVKEGTLQLTYDALLDAALMESDNTASDVLLKAVGGPAAVAALLQRHGLGVVRIDRYEREIVADAAQRPVMESLRDPRDSASPAALITLLRQLRGGALLSPASTRALLAKLAKARTGIRRLRADLPSDWELASKTGSGELAGGINMATNEVGVITTASGRVLYVAVLMGPSTDANVRREALIADLGRRIARWSRTEPAR